MLQRHRGCEDQEEESEEEDNQWTRVGAWPANQRADAARGREAGEGTRASLGIRSQSGGPRGNDAIEDKVVYRLGKARTDALSVKSPAGLAATDLAEGQDSTSMSRWEQQIASLRQASCATILALEERLKGLQNQLAHEEQSRKKWSDHAGHLQKQLHRARVEASELILQQRKAITYLTEDRSRLHSLISEMQRENAVLRQQVRAYMSQAVGGQEGVTGCITWMDGSLGEREASTIPLINTYVDQTLKEESRWLEGRLWKTPPANAFGDLVDVDDDGKNHSFFTPNSSPRIEAGEVNSLDKESSDEEAPPPSLQANWSPEQCRTGFSSSESPEHVQISTAPNPWTSLS
eukprot:766518-Hanusia_phi.AAC.10